MSDLLPFCLYEAVVSLYPLGADDVPLTATPFWSGAVANGLRLSLEYEEMVQAASGDRYATAHHLDERHTLEVEQTWLLRKPMLTSAGFYGLDFVPPRNQRCALEILWWSAGYWYRRWYWGLTARSGNWDSLRTLHFGARQSWRAERFTEDGGYVPQPIFVPTPGATGGGGMTAGGGGTVTVPPPITTPLPLSAEQSVGFFHEAPLLSGAYLLGRYRWPVAAALTAARAVGLAPQGAAVVLGLEVGGVLTGATLTLPVGTANTEVTADATLAVTVPPLTDVRWQIVSAPNAAATAWVAALGMQVMPVG